MFAGMALSVHLFVCAGLSLFIIYGPYLYVLVCVFYAYNLTLEEFHVVPWVLLSGLKDTWPMEQSTLEGTWARVGQVDLFWTNIGKK